MNKMALLLFASLITNVLCGTAKGKRRSLTDAVEEYHCARFTPERQDITDCSTIEPQKFTGDDYTDLDAIENWGRSQVKYWCCRMEKDSRFGLMQAAYDFNRMCSSNRVLLHSESILLHAASTVPPRKMDMFSDLVIYCPARHGSETPVDLTHLQEPIHANIYDGNDWLTTPECNETKTSETGKFTVILDVETATAQFGHMIGFFGDIEDLTEENHVAWGPAFLNVDQEPFDLLSGGRGEKQNIQEIHVSDAIEFTAVNIAQMKAAWATVQEKSYYALLDYNCVDAIWEILMPQLPCETADDKLFFAIPSKTFDVMHVMGQHSKMGRQITDMQEKQVIVSQFSVLSTSNDEEKLGVCDDNNKLSYTVYLGAAMMVTGFVLIALELHRCCIADGKYKFDETTDEMGAGISVSSQP